MSENGIRHITQNTTSELKLGINIRTQTQNQKSGPLTFKKPKIVNTVQYIYTYLLLHNTTYNTMLWLQLKVQKTIAFEALFKFLTEMVPKHIVTDEMVCHSAKMVIKQHVQRFWVLTWF